MKFTRKITFYLLAFLFCFSFFSCNNKGKKVSSLRENEYSEMPSGLFNPELNEKYYLKQREIVEQIPAANNDNESSHLQKRGPYNVGGRVRGVDIDINDEQHIIASSPSGELWQTFDGGNTWEVISNIDNSLYGFNVIVQDKRPQFSNRWYCGVSKGGQQMSARNISTLVYKSDNNGTSWTPFLQLNDLPRNLRCSYINEMVVSLIDGSLVVASSNDVFELVRNGNEAEVRYIDGINYRLDFPDADIASFDTGECVFAGPRGRSSYFFYKSMEGQWSNIMHRSSFGWNYRVEIALSNIVRNDNSRDIYVFATRDSTRNYPNEYRLFHGSLIVENGRVDFSLHDRSRNLEPASNYLGQKDHNQCIAVHPNNPDLVYIGSKGFFCSTDGFRTDNNVKRIGGGLHADNHKILFFPSNPNHMLVANDGGLYKTTNCFVSHAERRDRLSFNWRYLKNSIVNTQAYSVAISPTGKRTAIATGLQDQGSWLSFNKVRDVRYVKPSSSDGMFCQFSNDGRHLYTTNQYGNIPRISVDYENNTYERQEDEIWSETDWSGRPFFVLDQNQDGLAYVIHESEYINRYRNFNENFNIDARIDFPLVEDDQLSTLALSKEPANILYVSTKFGHLYRVENADGANPRIVEIGRESFIREEEEESEEEESERLRFVRDNNRINCIAVDPWDGRKVFVTFSGSNVQSIFYSENSGNSWTNVDGNLTGRFAPSIYFLSVSRLEKNIDFSKVYIGTNVGLFSTSSLGELDGINTLWRREFPEMLGVTSVTQIQSRTSDGLIALSTYGKGLYTFYTHSKEIGAITVSVDEQKTLNLGAYNFNLRESIRVIGDDNQERIPNDIELEYEIVNSSDPSLARYNIDGENLIIQGNQEGVDFLIIEARYSDKISRRKLRVDVQSEEINVLYDQSFPENDHYASFIKKDFDRNIERSRIEMSDDFEVRNSWLVEEIHVDGQLRQPLGDNQRPVLVQLKIYKEEGENKRRVLMRNYNLERDSRITVLSNERNNRYGFKMHLGEQTLLTEGKYWVEVMPVFRNADNVYPWLWRGSMEGGNAIEHRVDAQHGVDRVNNTSRKLWFRVIGELENAWQYGAPRNVVAEEYNNGNSVHLSWELVRANEINRPQSILIERKAEGHNYVPLATIAYGATNYRDEHNISDGLYQYRLKILQAGRRESNFAESNELILGSRIKAPKDFRILTMANGSATLIWEADFVDNPEYRRANELVLERRHTLSRINASYTSDFEEVAVLDRSLWVYMDQLPFSGVSYEYRLTARNRLGSASSISDQSYASFEVRPINLRAVLKKENNVEISWNIKAYDVLLYALWRKTGDNEPIRVNSLDYFQEIAIDSFLFGEKLILNDSIQPLFGANNVQYAIETVTLSGERIMSDWVSINENIIDIQGNRGVFLFRESELQEYEEIKVYPNPFSGKALNIQLPAKINSKCTVSVFSFLGKEVYSGELDRVRNKLSISLPSGLESGLYLFIVKTEDGKNFKYRAIKK